MLAFRVCFTMILAALVLERVDWSVSLFCVLNAAALEIIAFWIAHIRHIQCEQNKAIDRLLSRR